VNIGFAALTMNKDLSLSPAAFGFGAGLFLLGIIMCEVPSNIMLGKFGARRWLARIAVSWGLLTMLMSMIQGERSFYIVRFLIGAAEAGAFPGIVVYLSSWFPKSHRARLNALFLLSIPLTNAVSSPIAAALMTLDGHFNLAGWQWLFLIEGTASVLFGILVWFVLVDRPADAKWLSQAEKDALTNALMEEQQKAKSVKAATLWATFTSIPVILLGLMYSGVNVSMTVSAFWVPQIVKTSGLSTWLVSFGSAITFTAGAIAMIIWGRHSDRTGERTLHTVIPALVATAGWCLAAYAKDPVTLISGLSLAAVGHFSATAVLWAFPPNFLSRAMAPAGTATITAMAHIASALGTPMLGSIKNSTGSFRYGMLVVGAYLLITPITALILKSKYQRDTRS
jgi:ACS family tartrate transporter-like MFS transporter